MGVTRRGFLTSMLAAPLLPHVLTAPVPVRGVVLPAARALSADSMLYDSVRLMTCLLEPSTLSFSTRDASIKPGQRVSFRMPGCEGMPDALTMFDGLVQRIMIDADGTRHVEASNWLPWKKPEDYCPDSQLAELIRNGDYPAARVLDL